ncbi:putative transcription factor interactor and regulator CCHC(Zn) family [Arabidopsis thaliana]
MMVEAGDRGKPPDPPNGSGMNWVQKVVGRNAGGRLNPEELMDDAFVEERVRLEFPDGEDGEPVITTDPEVLEVMNGLWKQCMIVKVLGRNISITAMIKRLNEMWRPKGAMYVMDLPRQFFMVRFELEDEYLTALTGGPWRAFGSYLMVKAWRRILILWWMRLRRLRSGGLGKPLKVDLTTLNFERGRFAHVCVEVNLKKPLKGSILINGGQYFVSYEGLTNICPTCGIFGHSVHVCPKRPMEKLVAEPSGGSGGPASENQGGDGFTVVQKSRGRTENSQSPVVFAAGGSKGNMERYGKNIQSNEDVATVLVSNPFGSLEEEADMPVIQDMPILTDSNKENVFPSNMVRKGKGSQHVKERLPNGPNTKGKGAEKEIRRERRFVGQQVLGPIGPKHKPKQNRPMKGLVYGPSREEVVRSNSGKRLRVERESIGRAGGVFINDASLESSMVEASIPMVGDAPESNQRALKENQLQRDLVIMETLPGSREEGNRV